VKIASNNLFWISIRSAWSWFSVLTWAWGPRASALTSCASSLCQMVVLCFAVVFGSFSQSYGPYPSATKMVLPSQHASPESYTDSIGKSQLSQSCSLLDCASALVFHPPCLTLSSSSLVGIPWYTCVFQRKAWQAVLMAEDCIDMGKAFPH